MSTLTINPPRVKLTLLDVQTSQGKATTLPREIEFQYVPTNFTQNLSAAWASSPGMNRQHPNLQYSNGEQEAFTMGLRLFAQHVNQSIKELLEALKSAVKPDPDLKRPPRWQITWGDFIDETVVCQSIGGIAYDTPRSDGTLRGVTLSINFLVHRPIDIQLVAEDRPTDTFFAQTRRGEQWENIAARQYGDPMLGEILRRLNPKVPFPGAVPGKVVKLSKIENIRDIPIEPDSPPLRRTEAGLALRAAVYAARSVPRESAVVKK